MKYAVSGVQLIHLGVICFITWYKETFSQVLSKSVTAGHNTRFAIQTQPKEDPHGQRNFNLDDNLPESVPPRHHTEH